MQKIPVIHSSEAFFNISAETPDIIREGLLKVAQDTYRTDFNARMVHKLDALKESTAKGLRKSGFHDDAVNFENLMTYAINKLATVGVYDDDNRKNIHELTNIDEVIDEVREFISEDDVHLTNFDAFSKLEASLQKAQNLMSNLPPDMNNYALFPKIDNMPIIGEVVDDNDYQRDEDNYTSRLVRSRSIMMNDVKMSVSTITDNGEMGDVNVEETWKLNDKELRTGGLPCNVKLRYSPSAEDNDPSFDMSHSIVLLNQKYRNLYDTFCSRDLACQYIGPDSDDYKEFNASAARYVMSNIGKESIERQSQKKELANDELGYGK